MKHETKKSISRRPRKIIQGKKEEPVGGGEGAKKAIPKRGKIKEVGEMSTQDIARFWTKVNKLGPLPDQSIIHYLGLDRCWQWIGGMFNNGYGQFKCLGYPRSAHRVSFFLLHGAMPSKGQACHKCDNRMCVNPNHLFDGDSKDNLRDASKKGRTMRFTGSKHYSFLHPEKVKRGVRVGGHKMDDDKVREIRRKYAAGGITQYQLSDQFGITVSNINHIIHKVTWAHVD